MVIAYALSDYPSPTTALSLLLAARSTDRIVSLHLGPLPVDPHLRKLEHADELASLLKGEPSFA